MFDFIKKGSPPPSDVKEIRQGLLLFIKEQLRKSEDGEGAAIKGLQLYMAGGPEQHLYESAVFTTEPGRFKKEEVQRIADDFALDLPEAWDMDLLFVDELPSGAIKAAHMPVALGIVTRHHTIAQHPENAVVRVLSGEAEKEAYQITPASGRIYIGRDKQVQGGDGFIRENVIAFPSDRGAEGNKYVSRQHAHIEWDKAGRCFFLYADEGGIPPRNKTKVQRQGGGTVRIQTAEIGHKLEPGDQIVLGTSVVLGFDYIEAEQAQGI